MNNENKRANGVLYMHESSIDKKIISATLDLKMDDAASNNNSLAE